MNADDWKGILTQKGIAVNDMNKVQLQGQMIEREDREKISNVHSIQYVHADNHIDSEAVVLKRLEKYHICTIITHG